MGERIAPEDRVPAEIRPIFHAHGVPDYYDGPLYTGSNGAERVGREIAELKNAAQLRADRGDRTLQDETAPLPPGVGESADD